jgi:hypothetical protein
MCIRITEMTKGVPYRIKVATLFLSCLLPGALWAAPANDNFAKPAVISENTDQAVEPLTLNNGFTTVGATQEPFIDYNSNGVFDAGIDGGGEAYNDGTLVSRIEDGVLDRDGGASIWFKWTPLAPGWIGNQVTINTVGSNFDTLLGVYSSANPNLTLASDASLALVGENDDADSSLQSSVTFTVAAATTYYIMVDGYNAPDAANSTGPVTLNIVPQSNLPLNNYFENRIVLTGSQIRTRFNDARITMANGTLETSELAVYDSSTRDMWRYQEIADPTNILSTSTVNNLQQVGSVWFSWKPTYSGTAYFEVEEPTAGYYEILTGGPGVLALEQVGIFPFDVRGSVVVNDDTTYHIRVVYTRPNPDLLAEYNVISDFGAGVGIPNPDEYVFAISMNNPQARVIINSPRQDDQIPLQSITITTYFAEEDADANLSDPVFGDTTILNFTDRVKFQYSFRGSLRGTGGVPYADAENDINGNPQYYDIGVDETEPYTISWLPPKPGNYFLRAVAEDDEFGYDPVADSVIVVGSQTTSTTIAPLRVNILESFDSDGTSLPNNALTNNRTLVNEIYKDILGRAPTELEMDNALSLLDGEDPVGASPTISVAELAESIYLESSSSLKSAQEQLVRVYRGFFSRTPTSAEFNLYAPLLASGDLTLESLGNTLAATSEFTGLYGSSTDSEYVLQIHSNTGNPVQVTASFFTDLIDNGETRGLVGMKIIELEAMGISGDNAITYNDGTEPIIAVFLALFNRAPTDEELASTNSIENALTGYYGSGEYATRYISDPDPTVEVIGSFTVVVDKVANFVYLLNSDGQLAQDPFPTVQYSNWQTTYGGGAALDDPLGTGGEDTVDNITEYALEQLGFDPTASDAGFLPTTSMSGSTFQLDYVVDVAKPDAEVTIQYSDDGMQTFNLIDPDNPPTGFTVENIGFFGNTILEKRVSVDTSVCASCMFRVVVNSNVTGIPQK